MCVLHGCIWSKNEIFFEIFLNIFSDASRCVHQRDMVGVSVSCMVGEKIGLECSVS